MKLQSMVYTLLVPLLIGCDTGTQQTAPGNIEAEEVTIYRDQHGTPHVVADSNKGVYFGYGYAVATDRLFQMEMLKRTAEGRVAQVLGGEYLDLDIHLRTSYDHRSIRKQLSELPPRQLEILSAYAEGFNRRIDEVLGQTKTLLPIEFGDYGFVPEHWSAYDVAMIFTGSIAHRYSDFNSERDNLELLQHLESKHGKDKAWRIFNASKWLVDDDSPTTVPGRAAAKSGATPSRPQYLDTLPQSAPNNRVALAEDGSFSDIANSTKDLLATRERIAQYGFSHNLEFTGASNYWAARDLQDAAAALVNGPQFGFATPSYVYGIGLHGGDFNVVGNTLLALPSLLFAHNNKIAWGSTAGISDQSDEFLLTLDPADSGRYRYNNAWRALETWTETIAVKDEENVKATARRSAQGMVQLFQPEKNRAWARARSWEGQELATLMAWVFLATDTDLDSAHKRIGAMATNINMYTMDSNGNLGYVHSGRYPLRAEGHDSRLPAAGSGPSDWRGLRPYSDNPTVRNPEQGYIANWNNRPAADWISSDLWTYTWSRADRIQLIFDALERGAEPGDPKPSIADIRDINRQISFADVNAPFLLPYLFDAWHGEKPEDDIAEALDALRVWDKQWMVDETAHYGPLPTLMETWLKGLLSEVFEDDIGADYFHLYSGTNYPNNPLGPSMGTPPGLRAMVRNLDRLAGDNWQASDYDFFNGGDPKEIFRQSFVAALSKVAAAQGPQLAHWRLKAAPMQWKPYNFRGVPQARKSATYTLPSYMNRGSENNLFVANGEGIAAWDVIPPGQSGFQASEGRENPELDDQMQLYSSFGYKQIPFTAEELRATSVSSQTLTLETTTANVGKD